jgi:hypothetical protein
MTPWQKFKNESWEIIKEFWFMPFLIPIHVAAEFNAKLQPPRFMKYFMIILGVVMTAALLFPGLVFWLLMVIAAAIYHLSNFFFGGSLTWIKRINTHD